MSSSDYAQIADVTPARTGSERSKIYEEISELQSAGERSIFGVKLRSSFQKAHPPPTKSQCLETPEFPKLKSSVSSFKPTPNAVGKKQPQNEPAIKPAEPIYAKPNKPHSKPKIPAQTTPGNKSISETRQAAIAKKFNKPPPSFSPPPPPNFAAKQDSKSSKETNSPEYAQPICDQQTTIGNDTKGKIAVNDTKEKDIIIESGYAEISDSSCIKKEAEQNGNSDDDHTYYLADSISRSTGENTEAKPSTNEDVRDNDDTKTPIPHANVVATNKAQSVASSEGAYAEIDLSQVVRRKRGNHVTVSFSEESLAATNDATDDLTAAPRDTSAAERRSNFRSNTDDKVTEETYENQDVFAENAQEVGESNEKRYEHTNYGKALSSIIGSMMNSVKETDKQAQMDFNGEAFANLKDYFERNSQEGFDLETHIISCRNSVEKLQTLLMS